MKKYLELKNSKLLSVVDKRVDSAQEVAIEVDAVSIAVPTDLHFEIAADFVKRTPMF